MTTITFDSLRLVLELKRAGIQQEQAEAIVEVIALAQNNLVTKRDLNDAFRDFNETSIAPLRTDIAVLKWMMGIVIAGILSLVLRTFFS
jgi:hypothetical protein